MSNVQNVLASVRQSLAQGRAPHARTLLQRELQREPASPDLAAAMAVVLARLGEIDQAVYFAQRAARNHPGTPEFLADVGREFAAVGCTPRAADAFGRAIAKDPASAGLRLGIAAIERNAGHFAQAAEHMEAALERRTDSPALAQVGLNDWIEAGLGPQAARLAARMRVRHADHLELAGLCAYYANYLPGARGVTALHRAFGEMLQRTVPARAAPYPQSRDPSRRLRVGLLSPDLRFSAVGFFIEPFFTFRNRAAFELFGYSTALQEDAVGARLRGLADGWLHQPKWTDEQIASAVERDGVDVLIDLAGLTEHARLGVMAMRPAPVSATYLGYPNTTGLAAIGWRIADAVTDPPGSEGQSVERLLRMDGCFVCYRPPEEPPVPPRPDRPVTFGSFNNLLKFNQDTARVWGRVLGEVPGSRLAIKAPQTNDPGARAAVLKTLEDAGADLARIDVLDPSPGTRENLEAYARIDVALDTFPYNGTTTTCEALLMGVPVIVLKGDSHRARVGASLLGAAGLGEWIADTEDHYVQLAAQLAQDRAGLTELRTELRGRLLNSSLCDGQGWCRRFEAAIRRAWVSYCGGDPAAGA